MAHEGLIFDVQRFSVHDGPGIRTTVFFKGCPLQCRWCHNPESIRPAPEVLFYADRCVESGLCLPVCPRGALLPGNVRVDRDACDGCGLCDHACPFEALKVAGKKVSVSALLEEVLRDRPFYTASGGGVTLSGGEPTLQLEFALAFARACRAAGVGVGLQTCGAFSWDRVEPHLDLFEFIHFDLKVIASDRHRQLCGADNRAILKNARNLVEIGAPVQFRMPIIPDHTDDDANLRAVASLLCELGVDGIHLLRYHAMGEAKLPRLGREQKPLGRDQRAVGSDQPTFGRDPTALGSNSRGDGGFERATVVFSSAGLEVSV